MEYSLYGIDLGTPTERSLDITYDPDKHKAILREVFGTQLDQGNFSEGTFESASAQAVLFNKDMLLEIAEFNRCLIPVLYKTFVLVKYQSMISIKKC